VADRLDVVAVGIEHEGAVVIGVIMRADPGRAVVASAGREEAGENAILKTLDVDLQRIDRALAGSSRMRRIAGLEESRNLASRDDKGAKSAVRPASA
jgi:hypothetical protein